MKNYKFLTIAIILLFALSISACDGLLSGGDYNYKTFESKLRGTWVSNDTGLFSGSLKIEYDTITIDGYGEDWTSIVGDDSKRPFKDFPKRVPLKGYSEDGKIFIEYGDVAPDGIPYYYLEVGSYPQKYKLLEFTFGGRKERLQSQAGY